MVDLLTSHISGIHHDKTRQLPLKQNVRQEQDNREREASPHPQAQTQVEQTPQTQKTPSQPAIVESDNKHDSNSSCLNRSTIDKHKHESIKPTIVTSRLERG